MRISYNLFPLSWSEMQTIAKTSEAAGLHSVAVADSPLISRELYLSCAACLQATTSLSVMSAVTNPLTRHPSVTAASMMSLSEMAPGRVALGIATGDSAAWGIGLKPAKIAELRAYILAVKQLIAGHETEWQGHRFRSHWADGASAGQTPIYVACSGPKVLRMAVEVADGIIPAMGYAEENIEHVNRLLESACHEFGRDPATFDIWWYADTTFGDSAERILETQLASDAQWLIMGATDGKLIPTDYIPLLKELYADAHDLQTTYLDPDRGRVLVERARKLGLYDWLYQRAARLCGTPEDVAARLSKLAGLGVQQMCMWQLGGDGDAQEFGSLLGRTLSAIEGPTLQKS